MAPQPPLRAPLAFNGFVDICCEPNRISPNPTIDHSFVIAAFHGGLAQVKEAARMLGRGAEGRCVAEKIGAARDGFGMRLIHYAALGGSLPVGRYLLEDLRLEVDVDAAFGETAIEAAMARQNVEFVCHSLDAEKINEKGCTIPQFAPEIGNDEIVKLLLFKGAHVGGIALHVAASSGPGDIRMDVMALKGLESEHTQEAIRVIDIILSQHSAKEGCLLITDCSSKQLGGMNSLLQIETNPAIPLVSNVPTSILGMDVSHGSPGQSDVPSIAAVHDPVHLVAASSEASEMETPSVCMPRRIMSGRRVLPMLLILLLLMGGCWTVAAESDGAQCDAHGLSVRLSTECEVTEQYQTLACCDAIFATLGRKDCLCKVVQEPEYRSSGMAGSNIIVMMYYDCNGGPHISPTMEEECEEVASQPPPPPTPPPPPAPAQSADGDARPVHSVWRLAGYWLAGVFLLLLVLGAAGWFMYR